jgi:RNA polymerase sigma-70 factor (ECF subfamily)
MEEWEVQHRIRAVLRGEPERFTPIVEDFTPALFNFAAKMAGRRDDAGEIVQETFFRAYRDLAKFDGRTRFLSWLFGICANICYDHGKKRRRQSRTVPVDSVREDALSDPASPASDRIMAGQDERRLLECLSGLPVALRAAVLLRYHEDMTLAEVALRLRIGLSAAKMRIHRGLDLLRACMERAGGEVEEAKV